MLNTKKNKYFLNKFAYVCGIFAIGFSFFYLTNTSLQKHNNTINNSSSINQKSSNTKAPRAGAWPATIPSGSYIGNYVYSNPNPTLFWDIRNNNSTTGAFAATSSGINPISFVEADFLGRSDMSNFNAINFDTGYIPNKYEPTNLNWKNNATTDCDTLDFMHTSSMYGSGAIDEVHNYDDQLYTNNHNDPVATSPSFYTADNHNTFSNITDVNVYDSYPDPISTGISDISYYCFSGKSRVWKGDTKSDDQPAYMRFSGNLTNIPNPNDVGAFSNLRNVSFRTYDSTSRKMSLKVVHGGAFYSAPALQNVDFGQDNLIYTFDEPLGRSKYVSDSIGVSGFVPTSDNPDNWRNTIFSRSMYKIGLDKTPGGVDDVGIFENDANLQKVEMWQTYYGSEIEKITDATRNYHAATLLNIPDKMFKGCTNLSYFNTSQPNTAAIPSTVKRIGSNAFYGTKINSIILPRDIESIQLDSFNGISDANKRIFLTFSNPTINSNISDSSMWRTIFSSYPLDDWYIHVPWNGESDITQSPYWNLLKLSDKIHLSFSRTVAFDFDSFPSDLGSYCGNSSHSGDLLNGTTSTIICYPKNSLPSQSQTSFNFSNVANNVTLNIKNGNFQTVFNDETKSANIIFGLSYTIANTYYGQFTPKITIQSKYTQSSDDMFPNYTASNFVDSQISFWSINGCTFTHTDPPAPINGSQSENITSISATLNYTNSAPKTGADLSYSYSYNNGAIVNQTLPFIKINNATVDASGVTNATLYFDKSNFSDGTKVGSYKIYLIATYKNDSSIVYTDSSAISLSIYKIKDFNTNISNTTTSFYSSTTTFNNDSYSFPAPSTKIIYWNDYIPSGTTNTPFYRIVGNEAYAQFSCDPASGVVSWNDTGSNSFTIPSGDSITLTINLVIYVPFFDTNKSIPINVKFYKIDNIDWTLKPSDSQKNVAFENTQVTASTLTWTTNVSNVTWDITYMYANTSIPMSSTLVNKFHFTGGQLSWDSGNYNNSLVGSYLITITASVVLQNITYTISDTCSFYLWALDENNSSTNFSYTIPAQKAGISGNAGNNVSYVLNYCKDAQGNVIVPPSDFSGPASVSYSLIGSSIPNWLTIDNTGLISWTTSSTPADYTFTVQASIKMLSTDTVVNLKKTNNITIKFWTITNITIDESRISDTSIVILNDSGGKFNGNITPIITGTNYPDQKCTFSFNNTSIKNSAGQFVTGSDLEKFNIDNNGVISINNGLANDTYTIVLIHVVYVFDNSVEFNVTLSTPLVVNVIDQPNFSIIWDSQNPQLDKPDADGVTPIYIESGDTTSVNFDAVWTTTSSSLTWTIEKVDGSNIPTWLSITPDAQSSDGCSLNFNNVQMLNGSEFKFKVKATSSNGSPFYTNIYSVRVFGLDDNSIVDMKYDDNFTLRPTVESTFRDSPTLSVNYKSGSYQFTDNKQFFDALQYYFSNIGTTHGGFSAYRLDDNDQPIVNDDIFNVYIFGTSERKNDPGTIAVGWYPGEKIYNKYFGTYKILIALTLVDEFEPDIIHKSVATISFTVKNPGANPITTVLIVIGVIVALIIIVIFIFRLRAKMINNKILKQDLMDEKSRTGGIIPPTPTNSFNHGDESNSTGF